ncbi:MAG: alkene reductase, partial [Verrucomicrobiota bacterium]|nr:alkene reductase [Verrucomicrobiota bacterium]
MNPLFTSFTIGDLELPNRIIMAPLTRGRAGDQSVPNDMMVEYYRQRASAGLIITEATHISPQGRGWVGAPGIHNAAQMHGWQRVTDAVHAEGGRMFLQLWHMGRASHPDFHAGELPVAPSAFAISNGHSHTPQGNKPYSVPRALETAEIPGVVQQYADAAKLAQEAGFDGVEIHGANGYLIDQFLRESSNQRTDDYGGSIENRARFLLDVTEAVVAEWRPERVGLRISPMSAFNGQHDGNPKALFTHVAGALNRFGLSYLHVLEALPGHMLAVPGPRVTPAIRKAFRGPLMMNGGYTAELGAQAIERGEADLIAFGVPFLANPDLVERYRSGAPLNRANVPTFYSTGPEGYIDYPTLAAA